MYTRSTLTQTEAASVIELFEEGFTAKSVALALDLTRTLSKCCSSDGNSEEQGRW